MYKIYVWLIRTSKLKQESIHIRWVPTADQGHAGIHTHLLKCVLGYNPPPAQVHAWICYPCPSAWWDTHPFCGQNDPHTRLKALPSLAVSSKCHAFLLFMCSKITKPCTNVITMQNFKWFSDSKHCSKDILLLVSQKPPECQVYQSETKNQKLNRYRTILNRAILFSSIIVVMNRT